MHGGSSESSFGYGRLGADSSTALRAAYLRNDPRASAAIHDSIRLTAASATIEPGHREPDSTATRFVKPFLFGGLDGVTTSCAALAAAWGADVRPESMVLIGFAQVTAGALTMGLGEYLSSVAEKRAVVREKHREEWEVDNYPDGERKEMIQIYVDNGVRPDDAHKVADILSKYKNFWVKHMLLHELGLIPVEDVEEKICVLFDADAAKQALVMLLSFFACGATPLLLSSLVLEEEAGGPDQARRDVVVFGASAAFCVLAMLGIARGRVNETSYFWSCAQMLAQGAAASAVALASCTFASRVGAGVAG